MSNPPSDIAFSPSVKAIQSRKGSRESYRRMEESAGRQTEISDDLAIFIADQRGFFLATASQEGIPYIRHRGGPRGFLHVVEDDPQLLERLTRPDYKTRSEQVIVFKLAAWDVNCPQHIPVRFDAEDAEEALAGRGSAGISPRYCRQRAFMLAAAAQETDADTASIPSIRSASIHNRLRDFWILTFKRRNRIGYASNAVMIRSRFRGMS